MRVTPTESTELSNHDNLNLINKLSIDLDDIKTETYSDNDNFQYEGNEDGSTNLEMSSMTGSETEVLSEIPHESDKNGKIAAIYSGKYVRRISNNVSRARETQMPTDERAKSVVCEPVEVKLRISDECGKTMDCESKRELRRQREAAFRVIEEHHRKQREWVKSL